MQTAGIGYGKESLPKSGKLLTGGIFVAHLDQPVAEIVELTVALLIWNGAARRVRCPWLRNGYLRDAIETRSAVAVWIIF